MENSTSDSVNAALSEILRDDMNVDISRVTRDSRLIDDVGLDSVAFAVGMVAIEDKLGVALTEEDLLSCDTVGELEDAILAKTPAAPSNSRNVLASALSEAMTSSPNALNVLDADSGEWQRHPWDEVHARAQNVAQRIDGAPAVGLVGEPNVEFLAAIPGTFLAGAALSILPGPIRGADPDQWAQATLTRFRSIGVTTVFSHGTQLDRLRGRDDAVALHDVTEVAHDRRSTTFTASSDGEIAILQGTAGSTGTPKAARISPAAALANYRGLVDRVVVDHNSRAHSWLPIYHDMGLAFMLTSVLGGADLWQAPTTSFAGNPFGWLKWLTESRATMTAAPNMAYNIVGKYARIVGDDVDLSNLGFALNGGEPVDCSGTERFATEMARFGFDPTALAPSYGLAESTCAVTVPIPFSGLAVDEPTVATDAGESTRRFAVLGDAIPGMEVRINTDAQRGTEVIGREVGDVEVRGTSLMSGYVDDEPIDRDAWLPTGDIGYFVDGGLVVCGRARNSSPSPAATSSPPRSNASPGRSTACAKAQSSRWAPVSRPHAPAW